MSQPRDDLGRFASAECPATYRRLVEAQAPRVPTVEEPVVEVAPGRYAVYAPMCPHGHFRAWADAIDPATKTMRNCRACHPGR